MESASPQRRSAGRWLIDFADYLQLS